MVNVFKVLKSGYGPLKDSAGHHKVLIKSTHPHKVHSYKMLGMAGFVYISMGGLSPFY